MAKVKKCYLADEVLHGRNNVLQAGGREHAHGRRAMPEIGVESENMFVLQIRHIPDLIDAY